MRWLRPPPERPRALVILRGTGWPGAISWANKAPALKNQSTIEQRPEKGIEIIPFVWLDMGTYSSVVVAVTGALAIQRNPGRICKVS